MRKTILLIMIILFSSLAYSVTLENPTGANYAVDGATMYIGTSFKVNESNLMITRAIYNLGASCTPSIKEFSGDGNPVGESIINFTPCTTAIFCNATTEVLLDQSKEYVAGMVCTVPNDARYDATGSLPIFGPTLNYTDDKYEAGGVWVDLNGRQDGGLITLETDSFSGPTGSIIFNMPNVNPQKNNTQILFDINCTNPADISNLYFNLSTEFNLITNNTNRTIWQTNVTTEGSYNYFATCNDTVNSSVRVWTYDISVPSITINPTSFFNTSNQTAISRLQTNNLINITFTDNIDLFAFEINITNSSGVSRYFNNSESLSGLSFDFTAIADFSTWDLGEYNATIIATDSHTALRIDDYSVTPKTKELRFITDEQNDIKIKSEYKAIPTYNKLEDRYEFSFQFEKELFTNIPDEKVFRVYCDNELIERKDSKYKGHIICWNPETKTGNWLDFEGVDGPITITQKMDLFFTQYLEVKINTKDTLLNFHSIGGLNRRTTIAQFNLTTLFPFNPYLEVGTPDGLREWNASNEFSGIVNVTVNQSILNNILFENCTCVGCSIVNNNCRIQNLFHSDVQSILEYSTINLTFWTNLTINIFNRETNNLLAREVDVIIRDFGNFSTSTGVLNIPEFPPAITNPTIITQSTGFVTNQRQIEITDQNSTNVNVYLLNLTGDNTGNLIVQVFDDFTNLIAGANTKLLEYFPESDSFIEISQCFTDTNGECIFSIELNTKFYIVQTTKELDGTLFSAQSTEEGQVFKLDNTVLPLYLKTSETFRVDEDFDLVIVASNTSLIGNTSFLTATFNDPTNNEHTVCVGYFFKNGQTDIELSSTCATASAGIVNAIGGFLLDRTITNIAKIYVLNDDGTKKIYDEFIYPSVEGSFASDFELYLKPILIGLLLLLLGLSLYLKNIKIFAIGTIILSPTSLRFFPNWIGATSISFITLICIAIIYMSSKKQEF